MNLSLTTRLTGALVGAALLVAPLATGGAANAATSTLSNDAKSYNITFQGGSTYNTATFKAANATPVKVYSSNLGGDEYVASTYTVTVKSKGKTVYRATLPTYRALGLTLVLLKHNGSGPNPSLYSSEQKAITAVKAGAAQSAAKGRAAYVAAANRIVREGSNQAYVQAVYTEIQQWVTGNPAATSFADYPAKGTLEGRTWALTGKPANWKVTLTDPKIKNSYVQDSKGFSTYTGFQWGSQLPGSYLLVNVGYAQAQNTLTNN